MSNQNFSEKNNALIQQFQDFFTVYEYIKPYIAIDDTIKNYIEQRKDWLTRLKEIEFPVAFFGSFSAGKSTIINAILSQEILPEATQSTTAFPTIIRKGSKDEVFVYYIDNQIKKYLWHQLCQEIGGKISSNLDTISDDELDNLGMRSDSIGKIRQATSQYEERTEAKIDTKPYNTLGQLYQSWDKLEYKQRKSIKVEELKDYVEGHSDALFIDRIEVSIAKTDIPDEIVIVDLPGLAVANQRHIQFTKDYIEKKAKAFVVCMKPKHLLEGQEIEFLEEVNRNNPTILQRSFWVINQWDTLNDNQQKEEEKNFNEKIQRYNFAITPNRVFKFSALNYFLVTAISNGSLNQTSKLQTHLTNLRKIVTDPNSLTQDQAKHLLIENSELKSFADFSESLFNYLNSTAKDEFLKDAKTELSRMINSIEKLLSPLYDQYKGSGVDLEEESKAREVNKQFGEFFEKLEQKIKKFAEEIRVSNENNFWKSTDTSPLQNQLNHKISELNREILRNELSIGLDTEGSLSRLPDIMERSLDLTTLLRKKMIEVIKDNFIKRLNSLLFELQEINQEYLPESLLQQLEDKLSPKDITMRINGLADSLLYAYGEKMESIGLTLQECKGNTLEERIALALKKYEEELKIFIIEIAKDINKYIRRSITNHTEDIETELLKILKDGKGSIFTEIYRKIKVSEAIAKETKKRTLINYCYSKLVQLRN
jgi:GTP-binding protein EngB required for normal cell division